MLEGYCCLSLSSLEQTPCSLVLRTGSAKDVSITPSQMWYLQNPSHVTVRPLQQAAPHSPSRTAILKY